MYNNIINNNKKNMQKCLDLFIDKVNHLSQNRLSSNLLNNISLKLNNKFTLIHHISSIVVENSSTLKVTPFDYTIIKNIEKSIVLSNLDLLTKVVGSSIYVKIPIMTETRKIKIFKNIKIEAELYKINIRNIRRKTNNKIKFCLKKKYIDENQEKKLYNLIQKQTIFHIDKIKIFLKKREKELFN
ncbi:ribosome recycling factor [Enterobacteriaceae endosymbiont of Donacia bicoloricornis]|uniref:ribosome recycling factor n=1 Tax=Enterobacteriaceae endosymbiont of Donacia bicoloricornis TaxID=2675772 RepID=UPI0014491551|nr:ribosome recycling factor [Enterobacteriaceae endosymbiont of Donacia bicoloricornis]QJC37751.1 ribosome recycling factor [Enterobacteriaceae endosymbiont of Donacia bicoloricornis]